MTEGPGVFALGFASLSSSICTFPTCEPASQRTCALTRRLDIMPLWPSSLFVHLGTRHGVLDRPLSLSSSVALVESSLRGGYRDQCFMRIISFTLQNKPKKKKIMAFKNIFKK